MCPSHTTHLYANKLSQAVLYNGMLLKHTHTALTTSDPCSNSLQEPVIFFYPCHMIVTWPIKTKFRMVFIFVCFFCCCLLCFVFLTSEFLCHCCVKSCRISSDRWGKSLTCSSVNFTSPYPPRKKNRSFEKYLQQCKFKRYLLKEKTFFIWMNERTPKNMS